MYWRSWNAAMLHDDSDYSSWPEMQNCEHLEEGYFPRVKSADALYLADPIGLPFGRSRNFAPTLLDCPFFP